MWVGVNHAQNPMREWQASDRIKYTILNTNLTLKNAVLHVHVEINDQFASGHAISAGYKLRPPKRTNAFFIVVNMMSAILKVFVGVSLRSLVFSKNTRARFIVIKFKYKFMCRTLEGRRGALFFSFHSFSSRVAELNVNFVFVELKYALIFR